MSPVALGIVAFAAALAACFSPSPPTGAPCSESSECPRGQVCDPDTLICGGPTDVETWRDDRAEDFSAAGAIAEHAYVDLAGAVGPAPYLVGGVRVTGIQRAAVTGIGTPWDEIAAGTPTGVQLARGVVLDFGTGIPVNLGFTQEDNLTVILEGEIELEAPGMYRLQITADELGVLEIAPPRGGFTRVDVTDPDDATGMYMVTEPGWYRFRAAASDTGGAFSIGIRYRLPGATSVRRVPQDRLRAPVAGLSGVLVDGFEDSFLVGPANSMLHAGSIADLAFTNRPLGLFIEDGYSLRFATQVLIDVEGEYQLNIATRYGQRAWLDGAVVADAFDTASHTTITDPVHLVAGWHDLVVDTHRAGPAGSAIDVKVETGPAWAGMHLPVDHLRPVVGRATRWAGAVTGATVEIPDGGMVSRGLFFDVPPGFVAQRAGVAWRVEHTMLPTVAVLLDPPVGANITLAALGSLTGDDAVYRNVALALSTIDPTAASLGYSLIASDSTVDAVIGDITHFAITMSGSGGIPPLPRAYSYTSAIRELGDVTAISAVRWGLRQPHDTTTATVSVRTCGEPDACDAEPWTAVEHGARPAVEARRFAQYRVELTGAGDVPTALDWIELDYRIR